MTGQRERRTKRAVVSVEPRYGVSQKELPIRIAQLVLLRAGRSRSSHVVLLGMVGIESRLDEGAPEVGDLLEHAPWRVRRERRGEIRDAGSDGSAVRCHGSYSTIRNRDS